MNCQEVMELMQRHVDEDLNEQETSLLLDHVGHCPDCAAMLERLVSLSKGLEQLPRVVPPYSLVDAILPELGQWDAAAAESAPLAPRGRRTPRVRSAWIARISGVVAVGVVVGLLLVNGPFAGRMGSSQQDAALAPKSAAGSEAAKDVTSDALAIGGTDQAAPAAQASPSASAEPHLFNKELATRSGSTEPTVGGKAGAAGTESAPGVSATSDQIGSASSSPANGNVNKGLTVNPTDSSSEPPVNSMGIATATKEEAVSPDGRLRADVTMEGALKIFNAEDGTPVYEPAPDQGKRSGLVWSEDSKVLYYDLTDADGTTTPMYLQISEWKETAR